MLGAVVGDSKVIFGLPGNPMSVLVTAVRIALPVLRALAGASRPIPDPRVVSIADPDAKSADLWWYRPVRIMDDGRAALVAAQGSGDVVSIAHSDGFVEFPPGASGVGGAAWPYYPWTG
jgi:molybdopterin biosynthesis enzyme